MKFEIDRAEYERLFEAPNGMVGRYLRRTAIRLQMLARRQVGVDTGALRRSINYKIVRDSLGLVAVIGSDNRIALLHHEGSDPHIIRPRRAQTLRFYSHGRIVYAQVVRHPGTRPNRYLTDNLRRVITK